MATEVKETGNNSVETNHRLREKDILKKLSRRDLVAMVAGFAALTGALSPSAEARSTKAKPVPELSGYGKKTTPEQRNRLKAATVTIIKRLKDAAPEDQYWQEASTGTKMKVPGKRGSYILTDSHAFSDATGSSTGVFTSPMERNAKAVNVINRSKYEYAIMRPWTRPGQPYSPLQKISGISVSIKKTDAALLSVAKIPESWEADPESADLSYKSIPAISSRDLVRHKPALGQEAAFYATTAASAEIATASLGIYLGRTVVRHRKVDIFGIQAASPQKDIFNFGASGSLAAFATGGTSGPLSFRFNRGYGKNHTPQPFNADLPMDQEHNWFNKIQGRLGVKLDGFNTIGGFSVVSEQTIQEQVEGLNHFPTVISQH